MSLSVLEELELIAEEEVEPIVLDLPGWRGRLGIVYAPPADREQIVPALQRAIAGIPLAGTGHDLDLIIRCTQKVVRRRKTSDGKLVGPDDDLDSWEPLEDDGGPVRFDQDDPRLARRLKFPTELKAREQVLRTFRSDKQPWAVNRHVEALVRVLQDADLRKVKRVEGDSDGGSEAA